MKNKGFTLVEIIGVIVLLVAIAFIVYPSVINVINDSRDKAYQSQVNTIIKSARTYVMEKYSGMSRNYKIVVRNIKDYGLLSDNDLLDPRNNSNMENLCVNAKWNKNINQHEYSLGECTNSSYIGKAIYYDPVNHSLCNTYTESNSASGTIEGCLKWNILSENEDGTFNLLLDHNIVSGVKWYSSYDNSQGPTVAKEALNNAINNKWNKALLRTDSYSHTFNNGTENKTYTVSYNGMKARLPEAGEIATAVGHPTYNEKTSNSWFYFDSLNTTRIVGQGTNKKVSDYAWLFNNLGNGSQDVTSADTCLYYGCSETQANLSGGDYAYWTSTSVAGSTRDAWRVNCYGNLNGTYVTNERGVRPVITLSLEILGNDRIGDEVYYNPVNDSVRCETYKESNSTSGVVEGCLKWYVLSENENGTVNLLLDHNIVSAVAWYSSYDNSQGPTVAKEALHNAINGKWSNTLLRTDSYENYNEETLKYTVSYNGMKARLPEAQEIANAVGHTWNETTATSSSYFYFDSKNQTQTVGYEFDKKISDYAWLFNNINYSSNSNDASNSNTCLYYGCTQNLGNDSGDRGYWTSTAVAKHTSYAWFINSAGTLNINNVPSTVLGIRPVITIPSIILAE